MTIYDSLVFISADNINKIEKLYGKLRVNELKKIVNEYLSNALNTELRN